MLAWPIPVGRLMDDFLTVMWALRWHIALIAGVCLTIRHYLAPIERPESLSERHDRLDREAAAAAGKETR